MVSELRVFLSLPNTSKLLKRTLKIGVLIAGLLVVHHLVPNLSPNPSIASRPPSWRHPLGTDFLGRDVLLLLLQGGIDTLYNVTITWLFALTIGGILGTISAWFYGRVVDFLITQVSENIRSFPGILLILVFLTFSFSLRVALVVLYWPAFWRNIRVLTYEFFQSPLYESSLSIGLGKAWALLIHGLPKILRRFTPYAVVSFSDLFGTYIALEVLGLGGGRPTLGFIFKEILKGNLGAPVLLCLGTFVLGVIYLLLIISDNLNHE